MNYAIRNIIIGLYNIACGLNANFHASIYRAMLNACAPDPTAHRSAAATLAPSPAPSARRRCSAGTARRLGQPSWSGSGRSEARPRAGRVACRSHGWPGRGSGSHWSDPSAEPHARLGHRLDAGFGGDVERDGLSRSSKPSRNIGARSCLVLPVGLHNCSSLGREEPC